MPTASYNSRIMVGAHHASLYTTAAGPEMGPVEMLDDTRLVNTAKAVTPAMTDAGFTISTIFDPTTTSGSWWNTMAALVGSSAAPITYGPAGFTAGSAAWLSNAYLEQLSVPTDVNARVEMPLTFRPSGPAGWGHALTPLQTITSTTTGSSVDGTAATTAGAIANLHVSAISGSPSFVVTVQDSADASSWSTIATFATASAAITSEHLAVSGTIRRYVRAVCTITGGSTPSVTCQVSLARL